MVVIKKKLVFNSKSYLQLLSILNQHNSESRLIGGCVRDALLNKPNADIDIATKLLPHQVSQILANNDVKFISIGKDFGTITAIVEDEKFEITTLRKDISSNGRHPVVSYTNDFHEDAERRDFTINALSYCPFKQEIYDYFGGIKDLEERRVIFIGDPSSRIKEDYLRILRFFRFSNLYASKLDDTGLLSCIALRHHISSLSRERIKWEMDKILAVSNAEITLEIMSNAEILAIIFPVRELNIELFREANHFADGENIPFKIHTKYVLLFFRNKNLSIKKLIDLKFSKNEAKLIFNIIAFIKRFDECKQEFILRKTWLEETNYLDYILAAISCNKLATDVAHQFILSYKELKKPKFLINGDDLLNLGIKGKLIGQTLEHLKNEWIKSNFKLSHLQLLEILDA